MNTTMPTQHNDEKRIGNRKPKFDAVLFDLDGTLIDTAPDFISTLNKLLKEEQRPPLDSDSIRKTVSHGARALITLAFGLQQGDDGFEPLRDRLLNLYAENLSVESCLFSGADRLLAVLEKKQIPWGIVTNKPSLYAIPLVRDLNLNCSSLVCPDQVTHTKPHPEPLLKAAAELKVSCDRCLYVGDHRRDIEAGQGAGMKTVAALYGYIEDHDAPSSWQADYHIDSIDEILAILFP